jgi:hypothetical protein
VVVVQFALDQPDKAGTMLAVQRLQIGHALVMPCVGRVQTTARVERERQTPRLRDALSTPPRQDDTYRVSRADVS